jgi:predicted ATPase/signal transduction histidine kinase/ActR/RegA family two-component response regulator
VKTIVHVAGYRITEEIYSGNRTQIYRGIRESDLYPVTLKLLQSQFPSFDRLMQFRHQYDIGKNIDLPNVIKTLALEPHQNSYALILEDCGSSISLKSYLESSGAFGENPETLIAFLKIAIQIADALEGLYCHRVIHKDIKPANILIDPETLYIKLIDFSIASQLPKEVQEIKHANLLAGTLAYMSPEQTGRMNRGIDYRSDFYALGVTCYELLTGQLPFISNDPMELVHSHLAKQPVPVDRLNTNIPPILAQIVSKLMSKNAEDRYQNALGLKHDLEICLTRLQATCTIELFTLGDRDPSDRFSIPEKLYGREPEVAVLLNAFERVSKGITEIALVAGCSGIGKTVVVRELHKPIVRQRGYFIKGKYDQFQRNIPFSAFAQAFRDLMEQLLSESDAQLQTLKTQILAAVGENGQVLIDVIPELEHLIGKQQPAPELAGSAAQQRFNLLMQKFVRLFATAAHPLVLFIDDLQWADLASLDLLQSLVQDTGYLLVIGAYRDNEVSPIHPSILAIDEIAKTGIAVNTVTLKSLSQEHLNQLVADTLNCNALVAQPLAELVEIKTQGNPFFATQFLKALYADGLIHFDRVNKHGGVGGWSCDLARVRALAVTDDVVEFMALQLQKLPQLTQEALSLAACIGSQFDLDTLAIVLERSPADTAAALWSGLQENLVIPTTDIYKFFTQLNNPSSDSTPLPGAESAVLGFPLSCRTFMDGEPVQSAPQVEHLFKTGVPIGRGGSFRFLHDRIQQAAYSLIPDHQKPATHLKIGQLLLQNSTESVNEARLFDIVGHLNVAKELITDPSDRQVFVDLNLNAGKKARNATAYAAANIYLQTAIELLIINCWETQYQLTLDLYVAAAEAAYLAGDLERMEEIAAVVLRSAQTILDKVEIYRIQIAALTANGKMLEAISVGREALAQLGFELPSTPDEAETGKALQALAFQLEGRQIEDLRDLPMMSDLKARKTMELLADLGSPIFVAMPTSYPILSSTMVSLSLQFGNTPASALGYVNYGLVLSAFLGDVQTGYHFGKLALTLADRFDAREFQSRSLFLFANWVQHRCEILHLVIQTFKRGHTAFMETGDFLNAGYCINCYFDTTLLCGLELNTWETDVSPYTKDLERLKQSATQAYLEMKRQVALNLMARGSQSDCLIGIAYDEMVMIPKHLQDGDLTALAYVYIYKLMLAYLFGNYTAALEYDTQGKLYLQAVSGMIPVPVFHFYAALTHLALFTAQSASEQAETLAQVDSHQGTIELWAQNAPMNYLHKWELIEAEKQRVLGNKAAALEHYDRAIAGAREHQFVHEEALANELAAKFYLDWGKENIARSYLVEAYYCYGRWGATAKLEQLTALYPQLLVSVLLHDAADVADSDITDITNSIMCDSTFLDLDSLLKAARSISKDVRLDRLIANILETVIANAGADKCVLLLNDAQNLEVVAQVRLGQQPQLFKPIAVNESTDVAISLVNKVKNSLEPIFLVNTNHAANWFAGDTYLQQHQPHSVLCSPILNQGELVGILYLENQLTTSAFTRDRLETIQVLVTQAGISIENAKLYTELQASFNSLEQKVEERTIELKAATEEADRANQSKTAFFNNMSHELRTPLNAILGMAETLTELVHGPLNKQQLRCIEVMDTSGTHLLGLIDDILDMAKIEAGKLELYCEPIQIDRLCTDSLAFVKSQALKKQIQLEVIIPAHLPKLSVDERRIRQVLINLLTNAVKFTPVGGRVSLEATQIFTANVAGMQFAVSDTGIGIAPEDLDRLFQPFVQIDSAVSRKAQGTGLGLNLAREIVELHGGRVGVTSEINVGSRFTIDLPCGDLPFIFPLTPVGVASPVENRSTDEMTTIFTPAEFKSPPILIVDDDKAAVETISDYLDAKGYNIIVASNGREAISILEGFANESARLHYPQAILMDIKMPILDSLASISQLRADDRFARLPMIAMTTLATSSDRELLMAAGVTEYLSKPVTLGLLASTIQALVAHV